LHAAATYRNVIEVLKNRRDAEITKAGGIHRMTINLHTILLLAAVILFVLDALGSRIKIRAGFGLLAAGLACFAAASLF
jgi:formate-dependent nitrite reductase membrane component NrfD